MIKSELIQKLNRTQNHLPEKDIALCVKSILNKMINHLSKGGRIEIRDFGSFNLHYRPPRTAHNPKTGEKLKTQPKYAVHFKPGKGLKERINASRHLPIREPHEDDE